MDVQKIKKPGRPVLILAALILAAAGTSCGAKVAADTGKLALDLQIQNVFPKSGFGLLFVLKDKDGVALPPQGKAQVAVWLQQENLAGAPKDREIYQWTDISVVTGNYDAPLEGTPVVLDWGNFNPSSINGENYEADSYCTLIIGLELPDGTLLTADLQDVSILLKFSECKGP